MPSIRRSYKKVEYNTWIDENFITIAIANYYKKDYDAALRNFEYVEKFYSNDESNYHAAIWEAKINIEEGFYTDAHLKLRSLDLIIANQKEEAEKKLEEWNGDYIKVIKEYLNPNFEKQKKKEANKSVNQQIMTEIRNFCDKQMSDYQKRKEESKN